MNLLRKHYLEAIQCVNDLEKKISDLSSKNTDFVNTLRLLTIRSPDEPSLHIMSQNDRNKTLKEFRMIRKKGDILRMIDDVGTQLFDATAQIMRTLRKLEHLDHDVLIGRELRDVERGFVQRTLVSNEAVTLPC